MVLFFWKKFNIIDYIKKLIDIHDEIVKPLKIMAINHDRDLKNYIQELLVKHVSNRSY